MRLLPTAPHCMSPSLAVSDTLDFIYFLEDTGYALALSSLHEPDALLTSHHMAGSFCLSRSVKAALYKEGFQSHMLSFCYFKISFYLLIGFITVNYKPSREVLSHPCSLLYFQLLN